MSDAQSFYLLLTAFYLYECLSFAPRGAWAFVSRGDARWRWRPPFFHLGGAHKDVFCAPVIPWPGMIAVFPSPETAPQDKPSLRHLRKRSRLLAKITAPLRLCSLLVFLHYFLVLPLAYHFLLGSLWVIAVILAGELLAFLTAIHFYLLHKRLYPMEKKERRLETLFTAFLPWHAMRAGDLFIRKRSHHWPPLACLVSHSQASANLRQLSLIWRKALLTHRESELLPFLQQAKIDPALWSLPPDLDYPGQKFCPLCHSLYESGASHCADCRNIPLQTLP